MFGHLSKHSDVVYSQRGVCVRERERERERERVPIWLVLPERNTRRPVEDSATAPEVSTLFKGRTKTILSNKLYQRFGLPPKAGNAT